MRFSDTLSVGSNHSPDSLELFVTRRSMGNTRIFLKANFRFYCITLFTLGVYLVSWDNRCHRYADGHF